MEDLVVEGESRSLVDVAGGGNGVWREVLRCVVPIWSEMVRLGIGGMGGGGKGPSEVSEEVGD